MHETIPTGTAEFLSAAFETLRPSLQCYRDTVTTARAPPAGYAITLGPARLDAGGRRWACFDAARGRDRLAVCERIFNGGDGSWTDTSSWWWAATLGRANGPYWAINVVEPRT